MLVTHIKLIAVAHKLAQCDIVILTYFNIISVLQQIEQTIEILHIVMYVSAMIENWLN